MKNRIVLKCPALLFVLGLASMPLLSACKSVDKPAQSEHPTKEHPEHPTDKAPAKP